MENGQRTAFRIALTCAIVASIAPLVAVRYLPFTDLPEHVAAMATIARHGEPAEAATYDLAFASSPYLLYHCLGALLTKLTGDAVEANRILLVLVALAYPLSFATALRALGADVRLAVFGCMPLLGRALFAGLLPYVAAVPLYLVGVAIVAMRVRRRRPWHGVVLALLGVALFYSHLSVLIVFLVTALVLDGVLSLQAATGSPLAWAFERVRGALWLAPLALVAVMWARSGSITMHAESLSDAGEIGRMSPWRALYTLPLFAFDIFRSHVDDACAVGFWVALIALAVAGVRAGRREPMTENDSAAPLLAGWPRALRLVARMDAAYVPFACAVIVYVAMPSRVGVGVMLNVRLAPIVILAAVLAVRGPSRGSATTIAAAAAAVLTMVHSANAVIVVRELAARYMTGFDEVLAAIRPGSKVATLSFDRGRRETFFQPYPFAGAYHRVRGGSGGVASFSFTEMNHWSVQYREGARPPTKSVPLWIYAPCEYRNTVDGEYYDYVLVIGAIDPFANRPAGPAFRAIRSTPAIVLYEKVDREAADVAATSDAPCASATKPCCAEGSKSSH